MNSSAADIQYGINYIIYFTRIYRVNRTGLLCKVQFLVVYINSYNRCPHRTRNHDR